LKVDLRRADIPEEGCRAVDCHGASLLGTVGTLIASDLVCVPSVTITVNATEPAKGGVPESTPLADNESHVGSPALDH
jgi:hypothetical protein